MGWDLILSGRLVLGKSMGCLFIVVKEKVVW